MTGSASENGRQQRRSRPKRGASAADIGTRHLGALALCLLLVCLVLAVRSGTAEAAGEDWAVGVAERAGGAVVTLQLFDEDRGEAGQGSGFVVTDDGVIVTSFHVVRDAAWGLARLPNGSFLYFHSVIRSSLPLAEQDLVLLKCEGQDLPVLEFGDSEAVRVGENVAVIGSPLGMEQTLATGVVSAIRQVAPGLTVIQTSAPISPGSSGGPLLNSRGQVIGVNSAFLVEGQNLNFAVTTNRLSEVVAGLDDTAKGELVSLSNLPEALLGEAVSAEKPSGSITAWEPPSDGLDVLLRLHALESTSVYAHAPGYPGLAMLSAVDLLVEYMPPAASECGVTEELLERHVANAIRASGAVELSEDASPYVYVHLNCVQVDLDYVAYNLSLSLERRAIVNTATSIGPEGRPIYAYTDVWRESMVGECYATDLPGVLTGILDEFLAEMLNDIAKANANRR